MALSPVTFSTAAPVRATQSVDRVKRRSKADLLEDKALDALVSQYEPTYVALAPEDLASDETREALQKIKLGG